MSKSIIIHQLTKTLFNNVSLSSDQSSDIVDIKEYSLYSIFYKWDTFSGGANIIVEASIDGTNFTDVDQTPLSGASGSVMVNVEKAGYLFVRLRIDQTGGAGNFTAIMSAKVL